MYDLHNHLLPGIDDGPNEQEETLQIMEICASQGIKEILATPHRKDVNENHSVEFVRELLSDVKLKASRSGIMVDILMGMENHLDLDLPKDIVKGKALRINSGKYILVEMPWLGWPPYIESTLDEILQMGLTPIMAHPERMDVFHRDPRLLERIVKRGILTQITAGSMYGKLGTRIKISTKGLLVTNMCHIIASDTHMSSGSRAPDLHYGWEAAANIIGDVKASRMVSDTPYRILHG